MVKGADRNDHAGTVATGAGSFNTLAAADPVGILQERRGWISKADFSDPVRTIGPSDSRNNAS